MIRIAGPHPGQTHLPLEKICGCGPFWPVALEELTDKLPGAILDLLEAGGASDDLDDVPIELIAHDGTRVRTRRRERLWQVAPKNT